jgi:hypothetical protein
MVEAWGSRAPAAAHLGPSWPEEVTIAFVLLKAAFYSVDVKVL